MTTLVLVWSSVLKNEANTPAFFASPLMQEERTKVRGFGVRMRYLPWGEPSPSPSPWKGEATICRTSVYPTQPSEWTIEHDS
jgi:hypothetical protein